MINYNTLVEGIKILNIDMTANKSRSAIEETATLWQQQLQTVSDDQFTKAVQNIVDDENIKRFPRLKQLKAHIPAAQLEYYGNKCNYCNKGRVPVIKIYKSGDMETPVKVIKWDLRKLYEINNHDDFEGVETSFSCICESGQRYSHFEKVITEILHD